MNSFIVIEGICCSGKTTFCDMLINTLNEYRIAYSYNHGAFSSTNIGNELKNNSNKMNWFIGNSFYITDLLINTKNVIKPSLERNLVIQDRYTDSITTFISAYGKYVNEYCDIDSIMHYLIINDFLLKPTTTVYCVPKFEVIHDRMKKSKENRTHAYYRENPDFLRVLYDETLKRYMNTTNALIVDTNSISDIKSTINKLIKIINSEKYNNLCN